MKFVLITGVSGGMGRATAQMLADEGYNIIGLDQRDPGDIPGVQYIPTDLTDPESVVHAFDAARSMTDQLSAIIHMAGIYNLNSMVEIQEADFQKIFDVNVSSVYRVNKTFLPLLEPGARIVITTSELAPLNPLPFTGIYAVTKAALDKYAFSLHMELQLLGYHVIILRPGAVNTDMLPKSVKALDSFCSDTRLYPGNAARFHQIVDRIESRSIDPSRIASLVMNVLHARHPRFIYSINRNPLLVLMNLLPVMLQCRIIRKLLK